MRKSKKADREKVFRAMCKMSHNFYLDSSVYTSREIAGIVEMPRCTVLKTLHELRNDGLVERASEGCPARVSYGEVVELICDAAPPINGWSLTEKARETAIYKEEAELFDKSMEEWAERALGKDDDDNE